MITFVPSTYHIFKLDAFPSQSNVRDIIPRVQDVYRRNRITWNVIKKQNKTKQLKIRRADARIPLLTVCAQLQRVVGTLHEVVFARNIGTSDANLE